MDPMSYACWVHHRLLPCLPCVEHAIVYSRVLSVPSLLWDCASECHLKKSARCIFLLSETLETSIV